MRVSFITYGCGLLGVIAACASGTTSPQPNSSSADDTSSGESRTNVSTQNIDSTQSSGSTGITSSHTFETSSEQSQSSSAGVDSKEGSSTTSEASSSTDSGFVDSGLRELLSQTGLYVDVKAETLGPRVKEYQPQFELWTDNAAKRRWIYIPEGKQIDATYMDEWQFPVGTKIWKEFSRDNVRIETRLIEKLPPERQSEGFQGWLYMTYVWNDDLTEAFATVDGVENAKGTEHDVPSQEMCGDCHDMRREKPLGVSAVQLSHSLSGATIDSLFDEGWLSAKPEAPLVVPGTDEQQQLLGYFHANCGHCHREGAPANNRVESLKLWLLSTNLDSVENSDAYVSLVNAYSQSGQGSALEYRVVPGDPDSSEIMRRLLFRAEGDIAAPVGDAGGEHVEVPMPPLGTEVIDEPAVERVRNWILSLSTVP